MIIDIEQKFDRFSISFFGKSGEVEMKQIAIPKGEKYKWELAEGQRSDQFFKSWDEKRVKKTQAMFLNRYRTEEFLYSQPDEVIGELFEYNEPNVWFCDIEVEVIDEFPDPAIASTEILAISLVNSSGDVFVFGTKDLASGGEERIGNQIKGYVKNKKMNPVFHYIKFKSEYEMLYSFFGKWMKEISVITGWNFVDFDWKYLVNRCKRLGIDFTMCSSNGQVKGENEFPMHKLIVDYMAIYKKWDRVVKLKENYKLDTVAQAACGLGKIKYQGSFMDLYNTDYETYVYYNAIDTVLVYLINKNLKTMKTFFTLANVTRVEMQKAFSPIWMTESIMIRDFYKKKRIVVDSKKDMNKRRSFEGAYVKKPEPGLHEYLATFDFASLYPSTMRQFNISPETFKGKNLEKEEMEDGWIKTSSGAVFDNSKDSVMRNMLSDFYGKRREAKDAELEIDMEIEELKKIMKKK